MRRTAAVATFVALSLFAPAAVAQDKAAAEALFQKGRKLFDEKRYAEACPSFAESFRLDPVSGALLALAACHEAEGKLASAWAEYADVSARARREGKEDRATAAQERAKALEAKLGKITIEVAPEAAAIAGFEVRRDGLAVAPAQLGVAVPVDRGDHVVEANAPGRKSFVARVTVSDGGAMKIAVPVLEAAGAPEPTLTPAPAPTPGRTPGPQLATTPTPAPAADVSSSGLPLRTIGLVTGGVGLVVIGIGTYFGITAISKNSESNLNCVNDVCNPTGKTVRLDALSAGNTSTALFIVGALLTAGGVVLYFVGGPSSGGGGEPKAAVAATPMGVMGRF